MANPSSTPSSSPSANTNTNANHTDDRIEFSKSVHDWLHEHPPAVTPEYIAQIDTFVASLLSIKRALAAIPDMGTSSGQLSGTVASVDAQHVASSPSGDSKVFVGTE